MKRLIIAAVFLPLAARGQVTVARDSTISVTASRMTVVAPDRAAAYVIVEGTAETGADANARVETKLRSVSEAIRGLGTAVTAERPISYGVSLAQNPNGYPVAAMPTSYVSRAVMRVQFSRLDQVSPAIAAILAAGATSLSGMSFEASSMDSTRRERVAEIVGVARADATALAAALGGRLGALVDVTSSSSLSNPFGSMGQVVFDQRFGGQVTQPTISINTNVTLRYRFIR